MQTQHKAKYETIIHAPIEKVWDALTNPKIVQQYLFGTNLKTDWKVGGEIIFTGEWEGKTYKDKGIILEYIPQQKLSYSYLSSWSGKEDIAENYLWVCNEVEAVGDKTKLTITQSNYDEQTAKHSEQNWASIIDEMKKIIEE